MPADRGWALKCFGFGGQDSMKTRSKFVLTLAICFLSTSFVVASVLAEELLGFITKVDFDAKKVTVVEKDKDDEIVLTTDDKTEYFAKKGEDGVKVDKEIYEKIEKAIDKAKEKGKKGAFAKITYDKKVISKIERIGGKGKKAATTN
jgi:predicted secreted protein